MFSLKLYEASGHIEIVDQVPDRNAKLCEFLIYFLRILDDFLLLSLGLLLAHRFTICSKGHAICNRRSLSDFAFADVKSPLFMPTHRVESARLVGSGRCH